MAESVMRTRLAKAAFSAAGVLSRIKTPQRTYELTWPEDGEPVSVPAGRRWLPCHLSLRLVRRSVGLDPKHWDHWALAHDECGGTPCPQCGGVVCDAEG